MCHLKSLLRVFVWIPVITIGILIFGFSNQNAQESSGISEKVAVELLNLADHWNLISVNEETRPVLVEKLQYPVRKAAHMTEYMLFTISLIMALYVWDMRGKKLWMWAFGITVAYACMDEFHQLFVPGRAGRWSDVLIDSIGAGIGILLVRGGFIIWYLLCKGSML